MKISILIPFYNEEEMIITTHAAVMEQINLLKDYEFELLYINDGSKDRTFELMKEIARQEPRVQYISFSRNFGKEAGTIAGLEHATGDAVLLMDGDLQHPPSLMREMIETLESGYDIVSAKRTRSGEERHRTFLAQKFYQIANSLMDVELVDGVSEFRILSRKVVDAIVRLQEYNRFSKGLISWVGFKEKIIEYENRVREKGETKFNLKYSINYAIQGILSFNDKPLRICFKFGMVCLGISLLYLIWLFVSYLVDPKNLVDGYFTTIFVVVLFGGVQLMSIGVLGEYIGKIFYEVKRRPHYLIDETNIKQP